jgi:hypothetical protein
LRALFAPRIMFDISYSLSLLLTLSLFFVIAFGVIVVSLTALILPRNPLKTPKNIRSNHKMTLETGAAASWPFVRSGGWPDGRCRLRANGVYCHRQGIPAGQREEWRSSEWTA